MRTPITVVIPTLNEASQIAACIRHLDWAAEVIVVDAASTDETVALARAAGARVIDGAPSGIAEQRNAGSAAASHDWVFALDADERVGPELAAELGAVVAKPAHDAYAVQRRNVFHGRIMRRGHWGRDWVVRLFRRGLTFGGRTAHPRLEGAHDVGRLAQQMDHTPYRDLAHHLGKVVAYSRMSASDLAARGRRARWSDLALRPAFRFVRDYVLHGAFLDGRLGMIYAGTGAFGTFLKYAFLWERSR